MTAAHTPSEVGHRTSSNPSCASSTTESADADRFRKGIGYGTSAKVVV